MTRIIIEFDMNQLEDLKIDALYQALSQLQIDFPGLRVRDIKPILDRRNNPQYSSAASPTSCHGD